QRLGYRHLGLDLTRSALGEAAAHGLAAAVRADVMTVPLADGVADVVCAGEILEHVTDLPRAVAEACRILKPGGLLVIDTLADTTLCALLTVRIAERIPGGAPKGIHDPALFVDRDELRRLASEHGVPLQLNGIRPSLINLVRWFSRRTEEMTLVTTRSTAVLFQAHGRKLVA
nr:class I SAM-dependent methyltransferase [Geodermatophilaceae bacterium]